MYFSKILSVTSADKQYVKAFTYDNLGRITAHTDAAGTPFEATTRYQYKLSPDENSVIIIQPDNVRKKTIFDGTGRILETYSEKANLQGNLQSGVWQQQTKINYDSAGRIASNTVYTDNGQGTGASLALTTRFYYDVLGRVIRKCLPDGETIVHKYDDAHRCIIHYIQDLHHHYTSAVIDRSNVMGKTVQHIVLPATEKALPAVTVLCTQGSQQTGARNIYYAL